MYHSQHTWRVLRICIHRCIKFYQLLLEQLAGYLQLLFVDIRHRCTKRSYSTAGDFPIQVKQFFALLEKEIIQLASATPVRMKTAKDYALHLALHPNYLNAILKKHTGENVSTHIRKWLLVQAMSLLIQTNWTIKEISFLTGFSDPPNFSVFFKNYTGQTPADFRNRQMNV